MAWRLPSRRKVSGSQTGYLTAQAVLNLIEGLTRFEQRLSQSQRAITGRRILLNQTTVEHR